MEKFSNVDVIETLRAILKQNTGFYQDWFDKLDVPQIIEAAQSNRPEDKTLLWASRPAGTRCCRERDVFMQGCGSNNMWRTCAEESDDKVLAYAVEITGTEGDKVIGDVYRLDYEKHLEHLSHAALPTAAVVLSYADGTQKRFNYQDFRANRRKIERHVGIYQKIRHEPGDKLALRSLLKEEHARREQTAQPADLQDHIRQLAADKVTDEAQRIACEFARLWNPNGPDGNYMVKISEIFLNLATKDEVKQLTAALPYQSITFAKRRDGCPGLFAFVGKEENRGEVARRLLMGERPEPEARKKPPHKSGPERS